MHRTPGVGIFLLDNLSFTTPAAWTQFFQQTQTIPEVAIFLEVQQVSTFLKFSNRPLSSCLVAGICRLKPGGLLLYIAGSPIVVKPREPLEVRC